MRKQSTWSLIKSTPIIRNVILAVSILIVGVVAATILLKLFTRHGQVCEVPDFSGMSVEQATQAGSANSLQITVNDSIYVPQFGGGQILEQNPAPGSKVKNHRRIFVTINAYAQRTVTIPYVTGFSLRQAKNNLEVAGLTIDKLIYTDDIATNNVVAERYENKTIEANSDIKAPIGSGITLVVGRAEKDITIEIPVVVGLSLNQAKSRLWEAGLNIRGVKSMEDNSAENNLTKVSFQSPYGGNIALLGDEVELTVSTDQSRVEAGVRDAAKEYALIEEERLLKLEEDSLKLLETIDLNKPIQ